MATAGGLLLPDAAVDVDSSRSEQELGLRRVRDGTLANVRGEDRTLMAQMESVQPDGYIGLGRPGEWLREEGWGVKKRPER